MKEIQTGLFLYSYNKVINGVEYTFNQLHPAENMHVKKINSGEIYDSIVYLGLTDSPDNYTIATEEEYQAYLNRDIPTEEDDEATEEDLYNALAELGVNDD